MPLPYLRANIRWRNRGVKQMSWSSYLFNNINEKSNPVTSLARCTDEEIVEKISASTSSHTTKFNEDTFKPDTNFESFHHQVRIPISDRALLACFLIFDGPKAHCSSFDDD